MKYFKAMVFILFAIFRLIHADWVSVSSKNEQTLFNYSGTELESISIEFELDGYNSEEMITEKGVFQKISYWNEGQLLETGKPDLPIFSRLIAIPNEGTPHIEILDIDSIDIEKISIYPFQGLQSESQPTPEVFMLDEEFYGTQKGLFPQTIAVISEPAIMRDFRVVRLTIQPFQYNPQSQTLTIHKNVKVRLTNSGKAGKNVKLKNRPISRAFEPLYQANILNYDTISERNHHFQEPAYLFIYPDNSTVESILQPVLYWKRQKGFIVHTASTSITGTSRTQIKNFIQNAYDTWENPPEYICLVGDAGGSFDVPTWYDPWSGYNGNGDHPYTQLDGDDILADAIIGRLSFNNTIELRTIVNKILAYEKEPYTNNPDWFNKSLLVGDPNTSGYTCISTKKYIKELMSDVRPDMTYEEVYSGNFNSLMVNAVNGGVSYFNYRGWMGMSGWSNTDTDELNNGPMMPFVVTITCATGDFSGISDSRSERFLKAGTPSTPRGAIASVGTATIGTNTTFNNAVDGGIFYGIFNDNIYTPGGALVRGKLNLYLSYPSNPNNKVDINSYWNNLMGDPGIELWTAAPQEFVVTHDNQLLVGSNNMYINVKDSENEPVTNAWVSVLKEDEDVSISGYSNDEGDVILPVSFNSIGDISLAVTKHNFVPVVDTLSVIQSSQFVNIQNIMIDDDNSGASSGNNDGLINPGEVIELKIGLKNYGTSSVYNISGSIYTDSQSVDMISSTQNYGTIVSGATNYSLTDFVISIENNALGGEEIYFDMVISDNLGNQWYDTFILHITGANLQYQTYSIAEAKGNVIHPGQTGNFSLSIKNIGEIPVHSVIVELSCSHEEISIIQPIGNFGTIYSGETVANSSSLFEISAGHQIIAGSQIPFHLSISGANGFEQMVYFSMEFGEVTLHDPLGPDEYGYYCYDDSDVSYNLAPVYDWIEIDPDFGGSGTLVSLHDNGDDGDLQTVSIPFRIQFYGRRYNTITICSNGFLTPGTTENHSYMNWPIPGPLGTSPLIAPFWDDLKMGNGKVLYNFAPDNSYLVVQWSRVQNDYDNSEETFQAIIYNTYYYPTASGDSDIKFQYKVVNNTNQGSYSTGVSHGEYATVGIQDHTGTRGLQYTYSNIYSAAAKPLHNEMALLFTTESPTILQPPEAVFSEDEFQSTLMPNQIETAVLSIFNTGEASLDYVASLHNDNRNDEVILDEDFEGGVIPPNWTMTTNSSVGWFITTNGSSTYWSVPPGNGHYACSNDDASNDDSSVDYLITPVIDLSTYDSATLSFNSYYTGAYSQLASVRISVNGNNWTLIEEMTSSTSWTQKIIDISAYTGSGYENVRINFHADDNGTWASGWAIDDVLITGTSAVPEIAWLTLNGQSTVSSSITGGNSDDILIEFDSENLEFGTYEASIKLITNDPNHILTFTPVILNVVEEYLPAPQNVLISSVGNQVELNWDNVTGATGYKIYVSELPNDNFTYLVTVEDNSFIHSTDSNTLFYKIVAVN